jgi:hypothetical protein
MKGKLLCLIVLAIFSANVAYSQYVEDTITVNRTIEPPYIDGYDDGYEWETEEFHIITEWGEDENGNPEAPDPADITAKYKFLWDDEYLYFLGVVVDDTVSTMAMLSAAGAETWENDSWEFYIAPTLSKLESMEEMTQIRWSYATSQEEDATSSVTMGWSSFGAWPGYAGGFGDDFAEAMRELTGDGWVMEARLKLANIAEHVDFVDAYSAGDVIGWQVTVSDNDGKAVRDWIGSWIPDTQWDHADTLGILKLGADTTGLVDPDPEPEPVGLDKDQTLSDISIYPNPVAGELRISGDARIEAIEIINSAGTMVLRRSNVKNRIDVADLPTGLYFVKVYTNGGLLETHKFFKE